MKKWKLAAIVLLITAACAFCDKKVQPLKIVSATSTPWAGGIAANSGNNYVITAKGPAKAEIHFDSIWIKNEGVMPVKSQPGTDNNEAYFAGTQAGVYTITAKTFHSYGTVKDELTYNTLNPANPFNIDAAAVISYHYSGRRYLLSVKAFKPQAQLNLQ